MAHEKGIEGFTVESCLGCSSTTRAEEAMYFPTSLESFPIRQQPSCHVPKP
jgi:hypothetical protein